MALKTGSAVIVSVETGAEAGSAHPYGVFRRS